VQLLRQSMTALKNGWSVLILFYTVNTITNELHIETDADVKMKSSADSAIADLREIINYDKGTWLFESEQAKRF